MPFWKFLNKPFLWQLSRISRIERNSHVLEVIYLRPARRGSATLCCQRKALYKAIDDGATSGDLLDIVRHYYPALFDKEKNLRNGRMVNKLIRHVCLESTLFICRQNILLALLLTTRTRQIGLQSIQIKSKFSSITQLPHVPEHKYIGGARIPTLNMKGLMKMPKELRKQLSQVLVENIQFHQGWIPRCFWWHETQFNIWGRNKRCAIFVKGGAAFLLGIYWHSCHNTKLTWDKTS